MATCPDSNGYIVDEEGIDIDLVREIREKQHGRIKEYAEHKGDVVKYVENGSIRDVPCDIAMPSATQNKLAGNDAYTLVKNGLNCWRGSEHAFHA